MLIAIKEVVGKVKDTAVSVFKATAPARAESMSARHPEKTESLTAATLEAPLRRLQHSSTRDSILDSAQRVVAGTLLPSHLTNESARQFFGTPGILDALREVKAADLFHLTPPAGVLERLARHYEEIASANPQESAAFLASVRGLLVANTASRVQDPGGAAVTVAAVDVMVPRLDALAESVAKLVAGSGQAAPADLDDSTSAEWRLALRAASQPLLGWPSVVGSGQYIERPALETLLAIAVEDDAPTMALLGDPGAGKSALLSRLAAKLIEQADVTMLAIKADLIGAGVATEHDLQLDLGLPELPSVMLRRLAIKGRVYLLVDQLDALADRLDVKTSRLNQLLTLIRQMAVIDGVHIFVSCRRFEFTHDTRLTSISARELVLEPPTWESVVPVLEANGVSPLGWPEDAREVLRVPQQLSTFLRLKASGIEEPGSTYQAMLESLWNSAVLLPGWPKLSQVACDIAERMGDTEDLWLAASLFDQAAEELNALIAAGILTRSSHGKVGFSHQTVFEYVLARNFVSKEGSLTEYVAARMDSLFVRPKAFAALQYLRNAQPSAYEKELKSLWAMPNLRSHLRFLLIDFLGSQSHPSDQEVLYMVEAFSRPELRAIVLKSVAGSKGWFERLPKHIIGTAMSDDGLANNCFALLNTGWCVDPDAVTTLLAERWLPTGKHDRAMLIVLREAPVWTEGNLRLAETALRRATFGAIYAENIVATVGVDHPEVAIRMLRWFLDGELARAKTAGAEAARECAARADKDLDILTASSPTRPVTELLDNTQNWDTIPALAEKHAELFLEQLWPWFLDTLQSLAHLSGGSARYFGYPLWFYVDFRFDGETSNNLPVPALLDAITLALETLAADRPDRLEQWAQAQMALQLAPVHRLVAHSFAHNPEYFATSALNYLLADDQRYFLGNSSDLWCTTVSLVTAVSPHWTEAQVSTFVERVKEFRRVRPEDVRDPRSIKSWSRTIRLTQLTMVRALPPRLRPTAVQRNIDEESRVFPNHGKRYEAIGGFVGSPIDVDDLLQASASDIARAFKKIPDGTNWDHPKDFMRGGSVQLARAFGEVAKQKPALALEVLTFLEPAYGQRAAGETIQALAANGFDATTLMERIVSLHAAGFGIDEDGSFRNSVSQAVNGLLQRPARISDDLLAILEGWLRREARPNDMKGPLGSDDGAPGKFLLSGHPGFHGYDDPDYTILMDVIYARYARDEKVELLGVLQRYLNGPHSLQVWEGAMDRLPPLVQASPPLGAKFLGELLSKLPQLDGRRGPAVLMAHIHPEALEEVTANLQRWKDSESLAARKGHGELTALIALVNPKADIVRSWLSELTAEAECADAREGAAATATNLLWLEPQFRESATRLLLDLIRRNEPGVWQQLYELFSLIDKLEPEPYTIAILEAISENSASAPVPRSSVIVERLGTLLPHHSHLVARIASELIQRWRDDLSNMASPLGMAGQHIMDLALTLHRMDATRVEGLTMFEQLLEIDAYQVRETLDEIDHRVRPGSTPRFRRPPKRARRRRKQVSA